MLCHNNVCGQNKLVRDSLAPQHVWSPTHVSARSRKSNGRWDTEEEEEDDQSGEGGREEKTQPRKLKRGSLLYYHETLSAVHTPQYSLPDRNSASFRPILNCQVYGKSWGVSQLGQAARAKQAGKAGRPTNKYMKSRCHGPVRSVGPDSGFPIRARRLATVAFATVQH